MQTTSFLDSKAFERLEKIFAVVAVIAFAGAILPSTTAEGQGSAEGNRFSVLVQLAVFPILTFLVLVHGKRILNAIRSVPWIAVLCALAAVSSFWSSDPLFTFRRSIILVAFTLLGIYLGSNFEWDEQIQIFGWALVYMVVASYLVIVLLPDYGISHDLHNGAWKGVFSHKNSLGRVVGFGIIFLLAARPRLGPTLVRVLLIAATALLLVFSQSSTAFLAVAGCVLAYPAVYVLRVRNRRTLPLWSVLLVPVLVAVILVGANYGAIASALGKDPTLTGRTSLWTAVVGAIKQRPMLGYGYAVFWGKPGAETLKVARDSQFGAMPVHAHDGYLDVALDLGLVGFLIVIYGIGKMTWRAIEVVRDPSIRAATWPLMFIVYFVLFNLTESNLLISRAFLWLPFVSIYVALMQNPVPAPAYVPEEPLHADFAAAR
jgi:O-antigen ligase